MERRWKPSVEISPNCPTCGSSNTKFCYYNNYSLTHTSAKAVEDIGLKGIPSERAENKSGFKVPEFHSKFDPSLEFTNMEPYDLQIPEENCLNHLSNNDKMYYSGLESIHKHHDGVQQCMDHETSNYALPPLLGDDLSSQELQWLNYHSLQVTQEPVLRPETLDPILLFGNWSSFDLSSDDTFTKT
ncbi:putative Leucine-rich repeat protein kinase family protein [Hibiscus syriacus]|uniref:Leucine-rich repeat protein kinase family protein n=1 Tax=Hibiscus syriacus TaxID=106335 RepID=A0A6A3CBA6_HIBSY|nr:putative Leucine-rich repeat protein kinase family protein [Hibiscus syriacus]